jgi:hypothetical protein
MSYPPPGAPQPQPYPPTVGPQYVQQPYQQPYQQAMPPVTPPKNGKATAGLVLGIVGFVLCWVPVLGFLVGIPAIVFSAIALSKVASKGKPITGLTLGAVTVLLNVIVTASLAGSSTPEAAPVQSTTASAAPVQNTTASAAPVAAAPSTVATVAPAPVVTTKAPAKPPAEPALATSFGDGTYEVGVDVAPGKYRSSGATEGLFEFCNVSTTNSKGDTVDWNTANANEQVLITLKLGQTVEASGCEQFRKR